MEAAALPVNIRGQVGRHGKAPVVRRGAVNRMKPFRPQAMNVPDCPRTPPSASLRPQILYPLFEPVTGLPGIGPRLGGLIEKVAGEKIVDLLWQLPTGLVDRRASSPVADAEPGQLLTLTVTVGSHQKPGRRGLPWRIRCFDDSGELTLVYFNAKADWLEKQFPVGDTRIVSGTVEDWRGALQMVHPDEVGAPEDADEIQRVEPVYPLTANLSGRVLRKAIAEAVARAPDLPEWADAGLIRQHGWQAWRAALEQAHAPESTAELSPETQARRRLAYDELLATQVALQLLRARTRKQKGRAFGGGNTLRRKAETSLPFSLTGAQVRALGEIDADMASPARMLRLLQGDVGSGKTVVAWLAMLNAVGAGAQAALMAPTEVLARQHFQTIRGLAEETGVRAVLLTGRDKGKMRARIVSELSSRRDPDRHRHPCALLRRRRLRRPRHDRLSTSSTASASTSGWRSPARAPRRMCW